MISPVIKEVKRSKTVGQDKITIKLALRTLHNYVEFSEFDSTENYLVICF